MLVRLKQLRHEAGWSQQKLAAQLGVSQQSINKYENHDVEPDFTLLMQIADLFNTTIDYLIGHTDNPLRPEITDAVSLSHEEALLLTHYRTLTHEEKKLISQTAAGFAHYHEQVSNTQKEK